MFISNAEKEELRDAIQTLKGQVKDLQIEVLWLKSRAYKSRPVFVKTDDAPWGVKKDGTPRKRPGRPAQVMEITS
jgi:hypothetical protein